MPKNTNDDPASRAQEIAIRKKKNADAQAAFRARRANYIATLEETVTSLESVVLQLQDSCREARTEAQELRQQNASLRHDFHAREKFWRTLWQSRKTGENDELPPLPQPVLNGHIGSSQMHAYGAENMAYRSHDDPTMYSGQYNAGPYSHSSSMQYAGDVSSEQSQHSLAHRGSKYGYSYSVAGSQREHSWPQHIGQNASSSGGESGPPASANSSNSPSFGESPSLTSSSDLSVPFSSRFGDETKVPVNNLDTAPYVFPGPGSRSISPNGTTPSSSTTSLTSPFQFAFPDGSVPHERADYDYRRGSNPRSDVGLHAPGAEVSLSGPGSDAVRYRLGTRRADSSADRPLPILPPLSMSDNGSQQDRGSSDGDSNSYGPSRLRPRRDSVISPPSRSTSPSTVPPLSGTLAVIKAQAFGALRRTRARTKKTSVPAKTALDVLEARGIDIGVSRVDMGVSSGSKRQRTEESDDGEVQT
ncbi:hypothetical protein K438DRAFT_2008397 [Mycena galopus ATCC 62051]|nr:hypothetical protein K438DRAFT_2008397 [Mycena galopus ATCC 62051]